MLIMIEFVTVEKRTPVNLYKPWKFIVQCEDKMHSDYCHTLTDVYNEVNEFLRRYNLQQYKRRMA